jgi:hypothetical protein
MERAKDAGLLSVTLRVVAILCALAIFGSAPPAQEAPPPGEDLALKLRDHVVRIAATWRDGTQQHGFGFIVGERDDDIYIVTADHVVRGKLPDELAETITITYYSHQGQEFQAKLLGTHDANRDIAVLLAERPGGFQLDPDILRRSGQDLPTRGTPVWYIGRTGRWYVPSAPGTVNSVDLDERIWIDGLNVQVGTSGAPLVAADGIAGMIVADDAGGVSRALGIGFIERAFGHWAHPWQLRESDAVPTAPEAAVARYPPAPTPRQAAPAEATTERPPAAPARPPGEATTTPRPSVPSRRSMEATGPREEPGAHAPELVFNPGEIRRAIEADLAHYDPSALDADPAEYLPGVLAPALAIIEPEVRLAGVQRLQVAAYVTLEDIDLGQVSAVVTPKERDRVEVALTLDGGRRGAAGCAVDFQQRTFDLDWNSVVAAFTGLRAAFAPLEVTCPDLSLAVSDFRVDSSMVEDEDGLWSGHLDLALEDLEIVGEAGQSRADAAEIRLKFGGFDLRERARLLEALPGHYWPRRVALLGVPFDLIAADRGVLPGSPGELYAGAASTSDLSVALSGLKAIFKDGLEWVDLQLANGTIEMVSTPAAGLSYRHEGLSIEGAEMGLPHELALDVRFGQESNAIFGALPAVQSEQGLLDLIAESGPVAWEMAGASAHSAAEGRGTVWVKHGAQAPSAAATVLSGDPTTFLLETVLSGVGQEVDPPVLRRALEETILEVARVVSGSDGLQYQFEIEADFESERIVINGIDAEDVDRFFNEACTKYRC